MERIKGRQLSEIWPNMPEAQRFGLVKNMVQTEAKITSANLANYGSLYYKESYPSELSIVKSKVSHDRRQMRLESSLSDRPQSVLSGPTKRVPWI